EVDSAVSTHAPLGRYVTRYAKYNALKFQSARGATYRCRPLSRGFLVSIHAPMAIRPASSSSFNPRARAGRDASKFPLRGELPCFNPRARAGRDALASYAPTCCPTFQSTRPRGARLNPHGHHSRLAVFQSTRPRGARPDASDAYRIAGEFQSTRPRGARRGDSQEAAAHQCFNPRARAGRDIMAPLPTASQGSFNPRA